MCAAGGTSELFKMKLKLHQGSTFSPLLFVLVLDEVSKQVRSGGAHDLVRTGESRQEVEEKFVWGKKAMEVIETFQ